MIQILPFDSADSDVADDVLDEPCASLPAVGPQRGHRAGVPNVVDQIATDQIPLAGPRHVDRRPVAQLFQHAVQFVVFDHVVARMQVGDEAFALLAAQDAGRDPCHRIVFVDS